MRALPRRAKTSNASLVPPPNGNDEAETVRRNFISLTSFYSSHKTPVISSPSLSLSVCWFRWFRQRSVRHNPVFLFLIVVNDRTAAGSFIHSVHFSLRQNRMGFLSPHCCCFRFTGYKTIRI